MAIDVTQLRAGEWSTKRRRRLLCMVSIGLCLYLGHPHAPVSAQAPAVPPEQTLDEAVKSQASRVFSRGIDLEGLEPDGMLVTQPDSGSLPGHESGKQIEYTVSAEAPSPAILDDIARQAWRYFVTNNSKETGLFNPVHNYRATTMWDVGSGIGALIAAEKLGLMERSDFIQHIRRIVSSLQRMPLYHGELPNREYDLKL